MIPVLTAGIQQTDVLFAYPTPQFTPAPTVRTGMTGSPMPIDPSFGSPAVNVAAAALAVTQLHSLLNRELFADYWQQGLAAITSALSAQAASVAMLDHIAGVSREGLFTGVLPPQIAQQLSAWEQKIEAEWRTPTRHLKYKASEWSASNGVRYLALHIPVVVDALVRGAITLIFDTGYAPSPTQYETIADVVQTFAISGWRTSSLRFYRQRLEHSYLGYTVLQQLTSSLDVRTVLDYAIQSAITMLQAEAATIFRSDAKNESLVFMVTKGSVAADLKEHRLPLTKGVAGHVFTSNKPLIVNDLATCEWFDGSMDTQTGFITRNIVCVPLRVHNRTIGVLEVLNRKDNLPFTDDDLRWLQVIGEQVAVALYNAQLYESLRREQERLVKAEEEVRHKLARDLHDNTAQLLSLAIMKLDWAQKLIRDNRREEAEQSLPEIEQLTRQANRDVRTLLFDLRPLILESKGLVPALQAYHRQLVTSLPCAIHLQVHPESIDVNLDVASAVFNIIQEAVNNTRKHANASNIWIRICARPEELQFEIEDDGDGFDPVKVRAAYDESGSLGLLNMRERASMLGGELEIQSPRPGVRSGALIRGVIPLNNVDSNNGDSNNHMASVAW